MDASSLLGVWTGIAHTSNGWDMKITISIMQPVQVGSMLGLFDIPFIPCSGSLKVVGIQGQTLELRAEKLQGSCLTPDTTSLELLPDGTLLYTSKGKDWETRGILERVLQE